MGHKKVPDHRLKRLTVWRHMRRVDRWHNNAGRRLPGGVTAVAAHDAKDRGPDFFCGLNRIDEVGTDIFFQVATPDGEDQQGIFCVEAAAFEPFGKNRGPAFIVGARGELGHIIRRRIGLEAADFAKIVHGMAGIARAAPDAENEQPSATLTNGGQFAGAFLNRCFVELRRNLLDFRQKLFGKAHGDWIVARIPVPPSLEVNPFRKNVR